MKQIYITNAGVVRRGAMHQNWQGVWKALDNSYVPIPDVVAWGAFMDAIETTGQVNFAKAQQLKTDILAATTIEAVLLINW